MLDERLVRLIHEERVREAEAHARLARLRGQARRPGPGVRQRLGRRLVHIGIRLTEA